MTVRNFHIGDIPTITTGRLVSPSHMDGVYQILDWMTGDSLFTHQLPRACDECAPALRGQHPDLGAVEAPEFESPERVDRWLAEQVAIFGERRDVLPLAAAEHTRINPLTELAMNCPDVLVIPVVVSKDGVS